MLAAVCHAENGKAVYELRNDVPKPTLDGLPAGSVLVRTVAASICGSDLIGENKSTGRQAIDYLDALSGCCGGSGHELLGDIVEVVAPCNKFETGQRVLAMAPLYIRRMKCLKTRFENETNMDVSVLPDTGGFVEFFVSHQCCCLPVPEQHPLDMNPLHFVAAQPLGAIIHACRRLNQSVLGKSVAIVGQGPNGLLMTRMLANMGARRVVALDLMEERLKVSLQCGATNTIQVVDSTNMELYTQRVEEITDGTLCDVVVECVGHQSHTFDFCSRLSRDGGTVLMFGLLTPAGSTIHTRHFARSLKYVTSFAPDFCDFELALELIAQGRFDPAPLFSHTNNVAEFLETYVTASEYKNGVAKVLLTFDNLALDPSSDVR